MDYNVKGKFPEFDFVVSGASYAGMPRNNTIMYVTRKVEHLISNLEGHQECLCFLEKSIFVPDSIKKWNGCVFCENPQLEYARFAAVLAEQIQYEEKRWKYTLTDEGYYIGNNVVIGNNSYIEPGVVIGHNVSIGDNATILSGAVVKHAVIGKDFLCNENAVIGNYSFTMAEDENGNKYRIPALGRVIIGNGVEIGACNDVAIGACGDTILEDFVKLDGLVHIGHEAHLCKNTEITAGAIVAGFVEMKEHSYLGINSSIRNRIKLGENCIIGMGAVVTKDVVEGSTVAGNPARLFQR
ncbi:MAG: hypothetical protein HFH50_00605 [Lachnospiraceae bacterium]|jgi:UDP-3-O-[3-hydroxymyristoyl] glucosamine N-acyltransferase LpxD|nr:hypothetical protein [Lachnospiraceae bacterium]